MFFNQYFEKLFKQLEQNIPHDELVKFSDMDYRNISQCHFGLGLYIRNEFLTEDSELYNFFIRCGVMGKDDMSSILVRNFYLYENEKKFISNL